MAKKASKSTKKAPWKKSNPRKKAGKASKHLSPAKKKAAKASAKRAGRPYPNLVDNMHAASKKKSAKRKTSKKGAAKSSRKKAGAAKKPSKKSAKKSSRKKAGKAKARAVEKDPQGGLTAAGRRAFAKKSGSHLKPGVRKSASEMTPTEMRRKGSWAVRFYGRAKLPPLVDKNGAPTRLALSAHAWGEPVPRTVPAARKIAAKGKKLLARYHRLQAT